MTSLTDQDARWLDAAARYAAPFSGTTAENPTVAALVVDEENQTLIARAVTANGGRPHAEALALEAAGFEAAGRTLYLTLEPSIHWGRSPPGADAIIRSGVMRVVIGISDPDPRVSGQGIAKLEAAGIEVVLANHRASRRLHAGHVLRHNQNRPFVTLVLGDTQANTAWIDAERMLVGAVIVPAYRARQPGYDIVVSEPGLPFRTPLRVILADASGVDRSMTLIDRFSGHRTAIIAESDAKITVPASIEVIRVKGADGRPDLTAALLALAERGKQDVLVEAEPDLAGALLAADLVDRLCLAPGAERPPELENSGLVEQDDAAPARIFERPDWA